MEKSDLIQFLNNAAIFSSTIFIPILAKEYGASPFGIGLVVAIYNLSYFAANYFFGIMADRININRLVQFGLLLASVCFFLQIFAHDIFSLVWTRVLAGSAAGTFPAALAVYAYKKREGKMGKFTAYTSLGWAFGAILAGLIGSYNLIFMISAVMFLISFFASFSLEDVHHDQRGPLLPFRLIKSNLRIYIPYFLRSLGAATSWSIFPLFLIFTGADKLLVGVTYFINLGAQYIIMLQAERYHNLYLFNIGLLCTVLTFIAYALFPIIWVIMPIQLLLALSFSTLQVGAQQELLRNNREKASVIGILNSTVNFTAVIGPFLAGAILNNWDFAAVMWFSAGITFLGLVSFTTVLE